MESTHFVGLRTKLREMTLEGKTTSEEELLLPLLKRAKSFKHKESHPNEVDIINLLNDVCGVLHSCKVDSCKDIVVNFVDNVISVISGSSLLWNSQIIQYTFSTLIVSIYNKQQFSLQASSIPDLVALLHSGIRSTLERKSRDREKKERIEMLRALGHLLFENSLLLAPSKTRDIVATLLSLANHKKDLDGLDGETERMAVNCIGNFLSKSSAALKESLLTIYNTLYSNFKYYLQRMQSSSSSYSLCKIMSSNLRSLHFVISEAKTIHEKDIKQLLSWLRLLIFYGTPLLAPFSSFATSSAFVDPPKWKKDSDLTTSSDSDGESSEDRAGTWKIRFHALVCIASIAKASPKLFYEYWSYFIPSSPHSMSPSLLSLILHDTSVKVRSTATSTLAAMLDGSKTYLSIADDSSKVGSFISLSHTLGAIVRELHTCLFAAIDSEQHTAALVSIIKCLGVLVANVNYEKLMPGLLTGVISRLHKLIHHHEPSVTVSALTCTATALNTRSPYSEVAAALTQTHSSSTATSAATLITELKALLTERTQLNIRIEILQIFAALVNNYFKEFNEVINIQTLLEESLHSHNDDALRLAALKILEGYSKAAASLPQAAAARAVWQHVLATAAILQCFDDTAHSVRAALCNCFGNMNTDIFDALEVQQQSYCINTMIRLSADSTAAVRAASCRTLGVYILFPSVYNTPLTVATVSKALITAMRDRNMNVRIKGCWALGNLCDTFIKHPSLVTALDSNTLLPLLDTCVTATADNDKVRSNAVRALGNFARISPGAILEQQHMLQRIVDCLVAALNLGSVKVRWNACYGIGNLFQNEYVRECLAAESAAWSAAVFNCVTAALRDCQNFKIRINAALSLALLPLRIHYGKYYSSVWSSVLSSVATLDRATDFTEYKYKHTLSHQISATAIHLYALCTAEDEKLLQSLLQDSKVTSLLLDALDKYSQHLLTQEKDKDALLAQNTKTAIAKLAGMK